MVAVDHPTHDIGEMIGSYRLLELLGEGAMGRVYLAENIQDGCRVALKVLRSRFADDSSTIERFFGEARAVNQIAHENIVQITHFFHEPAGSYFVMEYLSGESLSVTLAREGALGVAAALTIAIQIASALRAIHGVEVVHRDLKPENIMLVRRPKRPDLVKILDFGVAKLAGPEMRAGRLHTSEMLIGTPDYMAPEQASASDVGPAADIYALGVILYQMLTGTNPFAASDVTKSLHRQIVLVAPSPSVVSGASREIPPALDALVDTCLMKDPQDRPGSMEAVHAALLRVAEGVPNARRALLAGAAREEPRVIVRWIAPVLLGLAALLMFTLHHLFGSSL